MSEPIAYAYEAGSQEAAISKLNFAKRWSSKSQSSVHGDKITGNVKSNKIESRRSVEFDYANAV